jgi:hypothetical protein
MGRRLRDDMAPVRVAARFLPVIGLQLLLAACSSSAIDTDTASATGIACVDDSKACIDQRQGALKSLLADKDRGWIRQPASPAAHASGVRMFAYKTQKPSLTCEELRIGKREADSAPGVLRGPSGQGLTPAQISRGVMFAGEVGKELNAEMKRRCRV